MDMTEENVMGQVEQESPWHERLNTGNGSRFTAFTTTTVPGGATEHVSGLKAELLRSGRAWRHHRRLLMHFSEARRARQRRRL